MSIDIIQHQMQQMAQASPGVTSLPAAPGPEQPVADVVPLTCSR